MQESTDPKTRIKAELIELLQQYPYSKVTVTMIADNLGMSRQNLYKHYSSKDEILEGITSDLSDGILQQTLELMDTSRFVSMSDAWEEIVSKGLDILLQNHKLILSLSKPDVEELTLKLMRNMITQMLGHLARVNGITIRDRDYFDLITLNSAVTANKVVGAWAESGMKVSIEKVKLLLLDNANASVIEKLRLCETVD